MNKFLHKKRASGFTLIELMITVTIIGIVAAIAYPSYNQHILKTHRFEGKDLLAQAVMNQERFFASNNTYTTVIGAGGLGYTGAPPTSEHGYYSIAIDAPTAGAAGCPIASCYSMTITAIGTQATDAHCATLTQTSTGRKSATNADCW